jgi:hypothetical protein
MSEVIDTAAAAVAAMDCAELRDRLDRLEGEMLAMPQIEIAVTHTFVNGLYAREIFIPKGTILTGKIHKTDHLNIISKGDISVITEDGVKRVQAPCSIVSRAGTKRAGYAHEDTVWTTIHATPEMPLDELEAQLIAPTHADYLAHVASLKIEGVK